MEIFRKSSRQGLHRRDDEIHDEDMVVHPAGRRVEPAAAIPSGGTGVDFLRHPGGGGETCGSKGGEEASSKGTGGERRTEGNGPPQERLSARQVICVCLSRSPSLRHARDVLCP